MSNNTIQIPALKVEQPLGEFLIASLTPKQLVDISYADVRRMGQRDIEKYLGIQRPLSKKRVKEIKSYIENRNATFPTSIIIAVDEKCAEYDSDTNILTLYPSVAGELDEEEITLGKIAKILDGQHRIAAFLDEDDNYCFPFDRQFELNVSIFIGIDVSEQANIFATVNLAQTKVNRSLVYDLEDLSKTRSPHKTCHLMAVGLDADPNSPLHTRIKRLGVATKGRNFEPLTQAVVVESLVKFISAQPFEDRKRMLDGKKLPHADLELLKKCPFRNLFIEERDKEIYKILFNFFSAVQGRWPNAWKGQPRGNLLPKSNAFRALMKFLKDNYPTIVGEQNIGAIPSIDEFLSVLCKVDIEDNDFTTRNFAPGSGGQAKFYQLLTGKIKKEALFAE